MTLTLTRFVGGMGSRGLLYHSIVAQWVVGAAVAGDAAGIPAQLRRGEWAHLLAERLGRLQALPGKKCQEVVTRGSYDGVPYAEGA